MFFVFSCAGDREKKDNSELYSKSQTRGAIIERAGVTMGGDATAKGRKLQMEVAENKLQSGGGLFGGGGLSLDMLNRENNNQASSSIVMPVNVFLWKGALETINFMPLNSADPFGGTILTDWYSTTSNENERCKLNIFIFGSELKSQNLKVTSFCQVFKNQKWVNINIDAENDIKLENAILNKAKKLRLQTG